MDNSPAYIMAQYLIGEAYLSDPSSSGDWKVFVGNLPDGDDVDHDAVGCMDTTPIKDGRVMETGETLFHFGCQLIIRSSDYNEGFAKADELKLFLETIQRDTETISGTVYRLDNITIASGVIALGQDGPKRRELFSLNFLVTLKEL